jgi:TPP-dependent pyruvate/acetoin dehydrogenase alpha subunit
MTEQDYLDLKAAAEAEVEDAVRFAEDAPLESVDDLTRFVYAEVRPLPRNLEWA